LMDNIKKIVFSRTLQQVGWKNVVLKHEVNKEDIDAVKKSSEKDVVVGSPSLIVECANLGLVDEFQLGLQPIIAGKGLLLFKDISKMIDLKLTHTRNFGCGAIMLYYQPVTKTGT
ncbi:MAG TPA: dihydrofolate reductase family protein, partial [Ferruginibacter sp.]|nr:dihydrofolate reductase family protein [Ferruginibacter sp.]